MFRVDNIKKSSESVKTKSVKNVSSGESFADYLRNSAISDEAKVSTASSVATAGAIFAAQMVDDEEEKQSTKSENTKENNKNSKKESKK